MNASQRRAIASHRRRLTERGVARYEVRGLDRDRELVRKFASRLAANDPEAERLRQSIAMSLREKPLTGKDIWEALRRSPLVAVDLNVDREFTAGRDADL